MQRKPNALFWLGWTHDSRTCLGFLSEVFISTCFQSEPARRGARLRHAGVRPPPDEATQGSLLKFFFKRGFFVKGRRQRDGRTGPMAPTKSAVEENSNDSSLCGEIRCILGKKKQT